MTRIELVDLIKNDAAAMHRMREEQRRVLREEIEREATIDAVDACRQRNPELGPLQPEEVDHLVREVPVG